MDTGEDTLEGFRVWVALVIGGTIVLLGLTWLIQGNDFFITRYFAPKAEQVRRETFEESKAYNEGTAQELRRMQLEYVKATPVQQAALSSLILHQVAGYDTTKLPPDLQSFVRELQAKQGL